jgi:hypothetical protein
MFILQIALGLFLFILLLFGSHYFLYFSLIKFLSIVNPTNKIIFLSVLFVLAVSFILVSILAHWHDNLFTRAFYFISSFWMGLMVNLLMASVMVWLFIWLTRIIDLHVSSVILSIIFFALAIIYSGFGYFNAMNPVIKNISVNIPNLPEIWQGKKIVQLSDVHLGHIYRQKFMQSVVDQINTVKPEMVVITGDLFDGMDGDITLPVQPLDDIKASKGTFFITGNHETYLGVEKIFTTLEKNKVRVLRDEVVNIDGLKLIGISYPTMKESKDILAILDSLKNEYYNQPNILLYHEPKQIKEISQSGVNLQLSGHTHLGQMIPFNFVTKLIYQGYDYGLHKIGDYTLYTTNGVGTWGPAIRTGNKPEIVVITLE